MHFQFFMSQRLKYKNCNYICKILLFNTYFFVSLFVDKSSLSTCVVLWVVLAVLALTIVDEAGLAKICLPVPLCAGD